MPTDAYQPLDLTAHYNAGAEVLGTDPEAAVVGNRLFHGLPFRIGEAGKAVALFGPGGYTQPQTIAINARAYSVILAHRLLGSRLPAGGPPGEPVATYTFHLSDGGEQRVSIRERFEIGDLATFGQLPFLARPDQNNGVQARWSGPWYASGARQQE